MLSLSVAGVAHAESNGLAAVEGPATAGVVLSAPSPVATGSEAYPDLALAQSMPVVSGGVIASNGGEAPVQSANSLPVGFATGTPAYGYALSVQRAFVARANHENLTDVAHGRRG